ncbi:MAG: DUF3592 domain-containing protein [Myxococcaceae bacterium]|nr:DUF3592 domain-containing protein [Myxococcaceae bacterium]
MAMLKDPALSSIDVQLAIPRAPRAVRLHQVPGAIRRVGLVAVMCLTGGALLTGVAWLATRWLTDDARFLREAVPVEGVVVAVTPAGATRTVHVIYRFDGRQHAGAVAMDAERASGLGKGASIALLVSVDAPAHARERGTIEAGARQGPLLGAVLAVGLVMATLVLLREVRRATRREVEPLRTGALVWLTPDAALPQGGRELAFAAHFHRDDVRVDVTARLAGARRPVRNGDKLLAAVAPREPTWVRVVDEEVALALGWYRA